MLLKIFLFFYNLAWLVAFPFLKQKPRIAHGWQQRMVKDTAAGPYDIWIQAASGGESLLTATILNQLATLLSTAEHPLRILVTSGTRQGIDILTKSVKEHENSASLDITTAYFPFDAPYLMQRAFALFSPKIAVIIETELWPGFLIAAKKCHVPVVLVNGRVSEKSYRSYRHVSTFFKKYGPAKILAISTEDQHRFIRLVGSQRVTRMNNIKFDRVEFNNSSSKSSPVPDFLPKTSLFVVLGSIRQEEEVKILTVIQDLFDNRSDIIIGLFPKHAERAASWQNLLESKNIPFTRRSSADGTVPKGTVIIWDIFGELAGAYSHAKATFVGGSLVDLGGQNFLEPLVYGLKPIIGPYWKDFGWVGREIVTLGLVREITNEYQLADSLIKDINSDESRDSVLQQVQQFLEPRLGGTRQSCKLILDTLHSSD